MLHPDATPEHERHALTLAQVRRAVDGVRSEGVRRRGRQLRNREEQGKGGDDPEAKPDPQRPPPPMSD